MISLFQNVTSLESSDRTLCRCRYGMIEVADGKLIRIQMRPWPKLASVVEARWLSPWKNRWARRDVCRVYYNQPMFHSNYLAFVFLESTPGTQLASISAALKTLDQIAFLKRSDAILAEVSNTKISDRLLVRLGWKSHLPHRSRRHWIKRFYGKFA